MKKILKNIIEIAPLLILFGFINTIILSAPSAYFLDEIDPADITRLSQISFCVNFGIAMLLSLSRNFFLIGNFIYVLVGTIVTYFMYKYNLQITYNNFSLIFDTSLEEKLQTFSIKIALLGIILGIITNYIYKKFIETKKLNLSYKAYFPYISLACLCLYASVTTSSNLNYPGNIIRNIGILVEEKLMLTDKVGFKREEFKVNSDNNLNVVLVIGESLRADRLQINGYYRETTPTLMKEKNLVSFSNFWSCGTLTAIAIPCILSRYEAADHSEVRAKYSEKTIISLFKELGFNTSVYSNQKMLSTETNLMFKEAEYTRPNEIIGGKKLDHEMLDEVFHKYTQNKPNFTVIHLNTNHFGYLVKRSRDFDIYKPFCKVYMLEGKNNCTTEEVNNDYDNGVLYNDFVIAKIINFYKDKNAIVIFSSDHGDSLGENGNWFHYDHPDKFIKEQSHIAALAFASDEFIKNNGSAWNNVKNKKDTKLDQYYIFHSLIDCAKISGNIVNKNKSLCSE